MLYKKTIWHQKSKPHLLMIQLIPSTKKINQMENIIPLLERKYKKPFYTFLNKFKNTIQKKRRQLYSLHHKCI